MYSKQPALWTVLAAVLVLGAHTASWAQSSGLAPPDPGVLEKEIVDAIAVHGFENVAADLAGETVTLWFENRIYRDELTALGVAARIAAERMPPGYSLELVPENRAIPLLSMVAVAEDWLRFLNGEGTATWFRGRLEIQTGGRFRWDNLTVSKKLENPSRWRTDFALRPLFDFELGIADDPFKYSLWAAPEATASPFGGALITLQANIKLHDDLDPCSFGTVFGDTLNDLFDFNCGPAVTPGRNTFSWGGWLPSQWLMTVSAGYFPGDRYGFAGEVGKLFLNGALDIRAGGDASGRLQFLTDVIKYSEIGQFSVFGAATYRTPGIDLENTLTVGRFRERQVGVTFDVARRFHEFEVGFFASKNEDDSVVGLNLRIPLPVRRYPNPRSFRPVTVPAFPFTYRESVEPIAVQVSLFDNLDRLRKRLYPVFIRNNLDKLRLANRYVR